MIMYHKWYLNFNPSLETSKWFAISLYGLSATTRATHKAGQQESVAKNAHKIQRGKHDSRNRWLSNREPHVKLYNCRFVGNEIMVF